MNRETIFRGIYTGFFYIVHVFSIFQVITSSLINVDYLLHPDKENYANFSPYGLGDVIITILVLIIAFGVIAWYFPKLFETEKEAAVEKAKKEALKAKTDKKKRKSKSKSRFSEYLTTQQDAPPEKLQLPTKKSKIMEKIKEYLRKIFIDKLITTRILWLIGFLAVENLVAFLFINFIMRFIFSGIGTYFYIGPAIVAILSSIILWFFYHKYVTDLKQVLIENEVNLLNSPKE